ncbi:Acetyltransferase (GNAT) domain-containing protein [Lachnospiraceae bacterium NE2001]|nr:Acetyltransferase (GNAT) domain-containing protein [Lachnospiraceae bacterium NE2001]
MNVSISDKWNEYLELIPRDYRDVYYTEEYVKLYESELDKAFCVICISNDNITMMPFLRRQVNDHYDFETVYGYGGPISNSYTDEWFQESLVAIEKFFLDNRYICGFIRFHPLIGSAELCKKQMEVILDRKTICIDMKPSVEDIWSGQISSKNRNMIRKAEKTGLEYFIEYDFESLDTFEKLYFETMRRLNADEFYLFDSSYFIKLKELFNNSSFLAGVKYDGKIIASAIFFVYESYGHYHLAGSDREYSSLGANNYMLWNTIKEMKRRGVEQFHLGGGTGSSEDDTLYKFKKSFSRNNINYYIGKWIFNSEEYNEVCEIWKRKYPQLVTRYGNRLLMYRYKGDK